LTTFNSASTLPKMNLLMVHLVRCPSLCLIPYPCMLTKLQTAFTLGVIHYNSSILSKFGSHQFLQYFFYLIYNLNMKWRNYKFIKWKLNKMKNWSNEQLMKKVSWWKRWIDKVICKKYNMINGGKLMKWPSQWNRVLMK
jgi:hypothetical protein